MTEKREFFAPEYYEGFRCKMGACRAACCEGWPVDMSRRDYFRLESAECSRKLRQRIDRALRVLPRATPECYAQIVHGYDGKCPLRMEDGRCAVHAQLGAEFLPAVCRRYPRGLHPDGTCACAASCEQVAETLLRMARAALEQHPGLPVVFAGGVMSSETVRGYVTARLPGARFVPGKYASDNAIGVSILAAREAAQWTSSASAI